MEGNISSLISCALCNLSVAYLLAAFLSLWGGLVSKPQDEEKDKWQQVLKKLQYQEDKILQSEVS